MRIDNPSLGNATATTLNKVTVTAPATGATLTLADGATLTASATASVSGTNTGDNAVNTLYSSLVTNATHTGDVTGSGTLTIASGAVTYAKIQNVSATSRVLGRITAAAGVVEELTGANLATIIGITNTAANVTSVNGATGAVTLTNLGLQNFTSGATVSGSNTGDNSVNTLYSSLVTNATHTGDVTGATALTIAAAAVTYAKIQNISATSRVLGRITAAAGVVEELTGANLATIIGITNTAANVNSVNGATGVVTALQISAAATTGYGFTPYSNANPSGYTTCIGTVTSVGGTGTVSGLCLTGSVTGSGNLTLGGAIGTLNQNTTGSAGSATWASCTCGNAASASVASTVTNNSSTSASSYPLAWWSGNTLYSTPAGLCVYPSTCGMYIAGCIWTNTCVVAPGFAGRLTGCADCSYCSCCSLYSYCTCGNALTSNCSPQAANASWACFAGCTCGNITGQATSLLNLTLGLSGAGINSASPGSINNLGYVSAGISLYTGGSAGTQTDGGAYIAGHSNGTWAHQIYGDFRTGSISVRGLCSTVFQPWRSIPTIAVQDTAPTIYNPGDFWWESDTGKLKINYYDGTSTQWVDAVPVPDMATYFSKAGGAITGPIVSSSSITASGIICSGTILSSPIVCSSSCVATAGMVCAGTCILGNSYLCVPNCVIAGGAVCGGTVYSGGCIQAGSCLMAGTYICSASCVIAAGSLCGANATVGCCITAVSTYASNCVCGQALYGYAWVCAGAGGVTANTYVCAQTGNISTACCVYAAGCLVSPQAYIGCICTSSGGVISCTYMCTHTGNITSACCVISVGPIYGKLAGCADCAYCACCALYAYCTCGNALTASSATIASTLTNNSSTSASNYPIAWWSGNTLYSTPSGLCVYPSTCGMYIAGCIWTSTCVVAPGFGGRLTGCADCSYCSCCALYAYCTCGNVTGSSSTTGCATCAYYAIYAGNMCPGTNINGSNICATTCFCGPYYNASGYFYGPLVYAYNTTGISVCSCSIVHSLGMICSNTCVLSGTYVSGACLYASQCICSAGGIIAGSGYLCSYANTCTACCTLGLGMFCSSACVVAGGYLYTSNWVCAASGVCTAGNVVAYNASDCNLKEKITVITCALAKVQQLRGVEYDWNEVGIRLNGGIPTDDGKTGFFSIHDVGVIAQEVERVMPEAVRDKEDGYKGVRYEKLIPLLIEAIKEQQVEIKLLQARYF